MKAWTPLTLVLALGAAAHARATCIYPQAPAPPPDGATATKDQMVEAAHDFKRYNAEMNAYLDCIKLERDAVTPKDPKKLSSDERKAAEEQEKILDQKNNAAVDELTAAVGHFNEQLKIFKARAVQ